MSQSPADFRTSFRELVETDAPEPALHPSPDEWLAYQRGELPAATEERLAEHLARCRDCCDLVQAAEALFGPAEPGAEVSAGTTTSSEELAAAALWRQLQPQLAAQRPAPAGRAARSWRRFRVPSTLAASLFLALAGLAGMTSWNFQQRSELAALRAPKPDARIVDLAGGERAAATGEVTLRAGSGPWILVLHPDPDPRAALPVYRLTIRDAASGREWSRHSLRLNSEWALTLQLPVGLPAGRYRLALSAGDTGGEVKSLQEHLLQVTAAGRGD